MLNGLFANTTIPVLEQAASFAESRHAVLASNVANIDVPGYRTRDLSPEKFQARLKAAISARDEPFSLGNASASGSLAVPYGDPFRDVAANVSSILQHDDTNVGLEQQINEITKNQLQHNLALTIMANQFRLLQVAISERV
jgi:flagellar basal-body rod protein FlgB